MASPSDYFALFKKFQILGHVADDPASAHGVPGGFAGLLGSSPGNTNSPLWQMLNHGATDGASVNIGGHLWPAMPIGGPMSVSPSLVQTAWNDFQINAPAPKVVSVFADWINAGKVNDIPSGVIAAKPAAIKAPPDSGVSPFVCSFSGDDGTRPGGVPNDYWDTSLIFLVDPSNGSIVTPATLTGGSEFYLVAVIGNRGQSAGGQYSTGAVNVEAKGIVMVWNTVFSPGVELPALSNLDVSSDASRYGQYFLDSGQYDVVGFRLNVQDVYDGIIAELSSVDPPPYTLTGGLDPESWVKAQPAHLCAKVVVRQGTDTFPNVGDTPLTTNKIGQKNLAPFDVNLHEVSPDPNIIWKNFIVGQPFFIKLGQGEGRNTLVIEENLPREAFTLYIALTTDTFERYFRNGRGGFKGFKVVSHEELCGGKLGEHAKPFPQAVILRYLGGANAIELPALGGEELLGMSIGIEYSVRRLKPGPIWKVSVVHKTLIPKLVPGTCCFEIKDVVAGGFTIEVRATDPRRALEALKRRSGHS